MFGKKQRQAISSVSDWVDQGCCHDLERGISEVSAVCSLLEMYNTVDKSIGKMLCLVYTCSTVTSRSVRGSSLSAPTTMMANWERGSRPLTVSDTCSPGWALLLLQSRDTWGNPANTDTHPIVAHKTNSFKGRKNNSSNNMKVHCRVGRWGCAPYHWRLHHRTEWSRRSHRTRGTRKVLAWERKWRTSWSLQPALDLWSSPRQHK